MRPYFNLRAYNGGPLEIGTEGDPREYVAHLVEVFSQVRRVLHPTGLLFVVIGDSYAGSWGNQGRKEERGTQRPINGPMMQNLAAGYPEPGHNTGTIRAGMPPAKNLLGIPWRLAFALQDDGWVLRQEIIWSKAAPMPESVGDRCTRSHEFVFMLAKGPRYYYDADAVREPLKPGADHDRRRTNDGGGSPTSLRFGRGSKGASGLLGEMRSNPAGRNKRSVWTIGPQPLHEEHYAAFPEALITPMVLAGTSEAGACPRCGAPWRRVVERHVGEVAHRPKAAALARTGVSTNGTGKSTLSLGNTTKSGSDSWAERGPTRQTTGWAAGCSCEAGPPVGCTVLDCFAGSGTVGLVCRKLGRSATLIELNESYVRLIEKRIASVPEPLFPSAVSSHSAPPSGSDDCNSRPGHT